MVERVKKELSWIFALSTVNFAIHMGHGTTTVDRLV